MVIVYYNDYLHLLKCQYIPIAYLHCGILQHGFLMAYIAASHSDSELLQTLNVYLWVNALAFMIMSSLNSISILVTTYTESSLSQQCQVYFHIS